MTNKASRWFVPVRGDEHILLGRETPLRRIPVHVAPKQAFFFDGIRHAVEIMDLAFGRLRNTLTRLAHDNPDPTDLPLIIAGAFLDAWAVVDAIDRFRMLYAGFPQIKFGPPKDGVEPLSEALQIFRDLRNVGDHVAQKADFVLARDGAALGELTWLTGAQPPPDTVAWHCTLRPGTLRAVPTLATEPIETTLDWPTDYICLTAGGYRGNLSAVRFHVAGRVRHLENQLSEIFSKPENAGVQVISDFFGRRAVKASRPPNAPASNGT